MEPEKQAVPAVNYQDTDKNNVKTCKGNSVTIETDRLRVKPRIGLFGGVTFIMGAIIGSGIFVSPKGALQNSGSLGMSLIIWILCGFFTFTLAMVYAELGVKMPHSGGDYTYIRREIGDIPAFLVIWVQTTITQAGGTAVQALVFADYLCAPIFGVCGPSKSVRKTIAAIEILSLTITNIISVRFAASMQGVFTILKFSALLIITTGGIVYLAHGFSDNFENAFEGSKNDVTSISLAIYSCMWAYSGYSTLNSISEEIIEPKTNIPRAIFISLVVITIIYITTNISYFTILTKADFLSASAVAFAWGDHVLGASAIIIPIGVVCSVYGASNGGFFTEARVKFAASRAGHLPEVLSYLHHRSRIPLASVIFNTVACLLMLIHGDIYQLINLVSFVGFSTNVLSICVLLKLKYKNRNDKKDKDSFSVPVIVPILALLICLFMLISPFVSNPNIEFLYGVAFVASGIFLYFPFVYFKLQIPGFDAITTVSQLTLEICPTFIDDSDKR